MTHIQHDELQRLARASRLAVIESTETRVMTEIGEILTYIGLLSSIDGRLNLLIKQSSTGSIPVVRADTVIPYTGSDLIAAAPAHESRYFVVPSIIASEK